MKKQYKVVIKLFDENNKEVGISYTIPVFSYIIGKFVVDNLFEYIKKGK